jgi:catalase
MANCREKRIISRQLTIFREVDPEICERLEKATGVKREADSIAGLQFNGTHNGFDQNQKVGANGLKVEKSDVVFDNGAPRPVQA